MKAMILAAGRGERMRPLTDTTPKPLLEVKGKPLIVDKIERLKATGFGEIMINVAWLGEKIINALGDGKALGINLHYSKEPPGALETAGGIIEVLDFFAGEPFVVVNSDIWCDYDFSKLKLAKQKLANLVLVKNPAHNSAGDFMLEQATVSFPQKHKSGLFSAKTGCKQQVRETYTFSGIGIYHPELFKQYPKGRRALIKVFKPAIEHNRIGGTLHEGIWHDIGTKERLRTVNS